jgi:hypothetical protein
MAEPGEARDAPHMHLRKFSSNLLKLSITFRTRPIPGGYSSCAGHGESASGSVCQGTLFEIRESQAFDEDPGRQLEIDLLRRQRLGTGGAVVTRYDQIKREEASPFASPASAAAHISGETLARIRLPLANPDQLS